MKTSTTTTAQTADSKSLSNIRFITITALFIALTYVFTAFINIRLPSRKRTSFYLRHYFW